MRRFECTEGSSSKFWEIALEGGSFTVRYGRIGTDGQVSTKSFADAAEARAAHDALVAQKTKKGYAEVSAAPPAKGKKAAPAAKQAAARPSKEALEPAAAATRSLKIFADFHHVYLCDAGCTNALGDAWTPDAVKDRLAIGDGVIGIGTARNMDVPVDVEVLGTAPPDDSATFQHVTECSLHVPGGTLVINGPTDGEPPRARRFAVPAGWVRVRASHRGLDTISEDGLRGKDRYRVQVWPAPKTPARVVIAWVPPERPKVSAAELAPPKTFKQAVAAAHAGRVDLAMPKLEELSAKGQGLAAVAAAEVCALRGDWAGFVLHAGRFTRDVTVIGSMNMFELMTELLRRAGRETGDWRAVAEAARGLPAGAAKIFHELAKRLLGEIAAGKVAAPSPERSRTPTAADRVAYDKAVREAPDEKRHKGDPVGLHRRLFSLASSFGFEADAVRVFEEHGDELYFDQALDAARYLVRQGRPDDAWAAIERRIPAWSGGYTCSIGPVEALADPELGPLFTPARGQRLLATPRGRSA